jgi:hypothetical protein
LAQAGSEICRRASACFADRLFAFVANMARQRVRHRCRASQAKSVDLVNSNGTEGCACSTPGAVGFAPEKTFRKLKMCEHASRVPAIPPLTAGSTLPPRGLATTTTNSPGQGVRRFGTLRGEVGGRPCRFASEIRHFTSIPSIPARDRGNFQALACAPTLSNLHRYFGYL